MSIASLLDLWNNSPEFRSVVRGLEEGSREQAVFGLSGSQRSFFLAGLVRKLKRACLVITAGLPQAQRLEEDLRTLLPGESVLVFPPREILPCGVMAQNQEMTARRLRVIERLLAGEEGVIIAPVAAIQRRLPPRRAWVGATRQLAPGDRVDRDELLCWLLERGYRRVDLVDEPGQCSARGGIVDLFPPTRPLPLRLELAGDELDSVREFDPHTQRSLRNSAEAHLFPSTELVLSSSTLREGMRRLGLDAEETARKWEHAGRHPGAARLREKVNRALEELSRGIISEGMEQYLPYFYPEAETLPGYLLPGTFILIDDPARVREEAGETDASIQELQNSLREEGLLPGQSKTWVPLPELWPELGQYQIIYTSALPRAIPGARPSATVHLEARHAPRFYGQWKLFREEIKHWRERGYRVAMVVAGEERAGRVRSSVREQGLEGSLAVYPGSLETGFELPGIGLALLSEEEVLGRVRRSRPAGEFKAGSRIATYQDLKVGDYVVHVQHGIGKYQGLQTLEIEGVQRDYLFIKYEGADRLYVPTDQVHLIQKYVGEEGYQPKLNRLGGSEWSRVKNRVKDSVREMALELLRLHALREARPGYAFSPDTPWQREFEERFPYEETPDQLQAVEEIKRDMEKGRPMDRLLCGDVGYGKTEVAIRAAFKAVMDGKQVAVLVPTTVLAHQHYQTFRERFAGYPVNIEMLSRFRTGREQQKTLQGLRRGEVDIVIGTHRLLQPDVRFKDLGLLVIDEEHRFGVMHKERLKRLRENVDVLTMSATPIPRTLHMSLVGLRDMSVIESPPEDRYPVQTFVVEYNEAIVKEAILRELARGGQVYYLHNQVQTIDRVADRLRRLIPRARVAVAHGQMKEEHLERVMVDFLDGKFDVLVCTTIIESGLDIANVNTLVVEQADHLGLAQLYQLRGRVGRSNRVAYAYFTYERDKVLTEAAEKRLEAILEFTEFGSGFKLALRDLEIRGAGNVLGPEQHGFMLSVGFDLYSQMLQETIRELKGEPPVQPFNPSIELAVDAYIDDHYIPEAGQKIMVYKKIAASQEPKDVMELQEELEDRYGELPQPVKNLLAIARIKIACSRLGIRSITQSKEQVMIKAQAAKGGWADKATLTNRAYRAGVQVLAGRVPALALRTRGMRPEQVLQRIEETLLVLAGESPAWKKMNKTVN